MIMRMHSNALAVLLLLSLSSCSIQGMQGPPVTEHHKALVADVGEWKGTLTYFAPGSPEQSAPATETVTAVGKYWTRSTFRCHMMGRPYTGAGCMGYDTNTKSFVGTWYDSWSTHMSVMKGSYDAKTKTVTMRWQARGMDGKLAWHRSVTTRSADAREMMFYIGEEGSEVKIMRIQMKRVKGGAASRPAKMRKTK